MSTVQVVRACAAALLCLSVISCDRNDPASVDGADSSLRGALRPEHVIPIDDVAGFESAWASGTFANNTIFLIESGSALLFPSDRTFGEPAADGKSFSIVGEDTTAVLKKEDPTTPLFSVADDTDPETDPRSILIDNIKFECVGSGSLFSNFAGYGAITVTDAVIDLEGHTFQVSCDNLLIDGSQIRARSSTGLNQLSRGNHAFAHTIQNSTFVRKHNGVGTVHGPCNVNFTSAPSGTLTWENNEIIATAASDGAYFYSIRVIAADTPLTFNFEDNNFRKQTLFFNGACTDATVSLTLVNNNSDLVFCGDGVGVDELIVCENCDDAGDNFDLLVTAGSWRFEGDPFDYDDFGPITDQFACYDEDVVYVQFHLASTAAFEDYQDVRVRWADDDCTTGATEVSAWWNDETGYWNASFDVSGIPDSDIYWQAKGVLCGEIELGPCIRRAFGKCGSGGVPIWFTQE